MDSIKNIVAEYGVYPYKVKRISERVYVVNDGRYDFAVKRSSLSEDNLSIWENVYRHAAKHNLSNISPVCLTASGNLYVENSDEYYYMTPWFKDHYADTGSKLAGAMDALGKIHATTMHKQPIQYESVKNEFSVYQRVCEELIDESVNYIASFEKQRYMSPFELLTCMKHQTLNTAIRSSRDHSEDLLDLLDDDPVWNYCLCHGNPELSHVLSDQHTYFINWEHARYDNPVTDLNYFFKRLIRDYYVSFSSIESAFRGYLNQHSLSDREIHLLTIHLLNPFPFISQVRNYATDRLADTMLNQTTQLNTIARELQFGIDFVEYANNELIGKSFMESED